MKDECKPAKWAHVGGARHRIHTTSAEPPLQPFAMQTKPWLQHDGLKYRRGSLGCAARHAHPWIRGSAEPKKREPHLQSPALVTLMLC